MGVKSGDIFAPSEFSSSPPSPLGIKIARNSIPPRKIPRGNFQPSPDVRVSALRGSLFEANATLFSAPGIPASPSPSSARGSFLQLRRNAKEFAREFHGNSFPRNQPCSSSFRPVRREVRGASFHPFFTLI